MFYLFYIGMPLVIGTAALLGLWVFERTDRESGDTERHPAE